MWSVLASCQTCDCLLLKMLVCSLFSVTVTDLRDLKTVLQEVYPGKLFWINFGDNDRSVKGQNDRGLAQKPNLRDVFAIKT